jgi:hypothetical protein
MAKATRIYLADPQDPIYKEPAGILFTGLFRKPGKKPKKASKPKKEK